METFLSAIEGVVAELISGFGMMVHVFDNDDDSDLSWDVEGEDEPKPINLLLYFISVLELRSDGV